MRGRTAAELSMGTPRRCSRNLRQPCLVQVISTATSVRVSVVDAGCFRCPLRPLLSCRASNSPRFSTTKPGSNGYRQACSSKCARPYGCRCASSSIAMRPPSTPRSYGPSTQTCRQDGQDSLPTVGANRPDRCRYRVPSWSLVTVSSASLTAQRTRSPRLSTGKPFPSSSGLRPFVSVTGRDPI